MRLGNQRRSTGQNKVFQWSQFFIPAVDGRLQALHFGRIQRLIAGHRQLATQVEQAVLARCQYLDDFLQTLSIQPCQ
ncbi:hypothetical protein D3C80_2079510 [compost metagenome]